MAKLSDAVIYRCTLCQYKTTDEENMNNHIWKRECPHGSFSYKRG